MNRDKIFIEFKDVSYSYDDEGPKAVENISFNIFPGEFVAIIGRNGSGKSTIAKMMNGLISPDEGVVTVDGIDVSLEENIWDVRRKVAMVFQNPDNQIIGTSVEEDIAFGLENIGTPRKEMFERIDWALQTVNLTEYRKHEPHLLSGGQKQRVAIAGVLAMHPECIVFDESTAMLDPSGRRDVLEIAAKLNKEKNITVVLITHHMEEVVLADRVILINKGKIVSQGSPEEIFSSEEIIYNAGLEVPQVTALGNILRDKGLDIPQGMITTQKAYEFYSEKIQEKY